MRSLVPSGTKTIGKLIIVLGVSVVGGYFALASGYYGAIGAYYSIKGHQGWSEAEMDAAMIYWMLLLQAILSVNGVIAAWAWLLLVRSVKPLAKRGS